MKSGAHSDILQTVQVPITSTRRCNEHFSKHNVEISEGTQMCAGVEGSDSCQGDSGGPLLVNMGQQGYVQLGIVSFGSR